MAAIATIRVTPCGFEILWESLRKSGPGQKVGPENGIWESESSMEIVTEGAFAEYSQPEQDTDIFFHFNPPSRVPPFLAPPDLFIRPQTRDTEQT
jgi:hypothetical protein